MVDFKPSNWHFLLCPRVDGLDSPLQVSAGGGASSITASLSLLPFFMWHLPRPLCSSGWIAPCVHIDLVCLWENVGSGSFHTIILDSLLVWTYFFRFPSSLISSLFYYIKGNMHETSFFLPFQGFCLFCLFLLICQHSLWIICQGTCCQGTCLPVQVESFHVKQEATVWHIDRCSYPAARQSVY